MATTDEQLPEDIIVQILYRLPVKTLVRFKSVSKRWSSIVSDPQFAKSQFKFTSERKTLSHRLLLSTVPQWESQLESLDLQTLSFEDDASVRKLTYPFKEPGGCAVKILASCNDHFSIPTVEMYSSKANSWKGIESQPHVCSEDYFTKPKGTFLNEALHWLHDAVPEDEDKPTIIVFDLVKEKFREMPLPLLKQDDKCGCFFSDMGVVSGGCLCVASYGDSNYYCGDYIQLWIMMDYDVCESWTKWIKLVDDDHIHPPFVYWEKSVVMVSDDEEDPEWNQELVRFDHKEEKLDKVAVCSGRYRLEVGDFDMIEYDESLLWLHDYQGAEGR